MKYVNRFWVHMSWLKIYHSQRMEENYINILVSKEVFQSFCWPPTPRSFSSAPSETACMVAHMSSRTHMIPGGFLDSIRSQTILLLKYSIGVHLMPSWTYSSWNMLKTMFSFFVCKFRGHQYTVIIIYINKANMLHQTEMKNSTIGELYYMNSIDFTLQGFANIKHQMINSILTSALSYFYQTRTLNKNYLCANMYLEYIEINMLY